MAIETMLTTKFDVARAFQHLDQLRADFRAADRADGHDQAKLQIDIAQRPMPFRRHDRFADDVGEIGADGEIPVQARPRATPVRQ